MKRFLKWVIKAGAAGILALAALCAFCLLYYNIPVHYANESGATDYHWEKNRFYSGAFEGFGYGRMNNEGFPNLRDRAEGERPDILLMGSSQLEARNVPQKKSAAVLLNEMFDGDKYVYNIATAGHTLMHCVKNLDDALTYYQPTEYVLIETCIPDYSEQELELLLNGEYPSLPSHSGGIVGLLQKLPYLRMFYNKYIGGMNGGDISAAAADAVRDAAANRELLDRVMAYISQTASEHSVTPVLALECALELDEQGEVHIEFPEYKRAMYRELCEKNGIVFIDVGEAFSEQYGKDNIMPMGFANTEPGVGHMNTHGHYLFAKTVYNTIEEMEA